MKRRLILITLNAKLPSSVFLYFNDNR
jgi:hypothetical protein